MSSEIFKLLDPTKTPDENASRLAFGRWVLGAEMTQAQYDYLRSGPDGGRIRLTEYQGRDGDGHRWWMGGLRDGGGYHMDDWRYPNVRSNLGEYYFIRYEEYRDGDFPPVPA